MVVGNLSWELYNGDNLTPNTKNFYHCDRNHTNNEFKNIFVLGLVVTTLLVMVSMFLSVVSSLPESKWNHFNIYDINLLNEWTI